MLKHKQLKLIVNQLRIVEGHNLGCIRIL